MMKMIVKQENEDATAKVDVKMQNIDKRLVNMRNEFDMNKLQKMIKTKAETKEVSSLENDLRHLLAETDNKQNLITTDFSLAVKAINKMNSRLMELSDINRDVLIGKRNANCISCSKMQDDFAPQK